MNIAAAAFALALIGAGVTSAQAQVVNGGFEQNQPPATGYTDYSAGQSLGGWNVTSFGAPGGNVSLVSSGFGAENFKPNSGNVFLDLTGSRDNSIYQMGISQTVNTITGEAYSLTFFVGHRIDKAGETKIGVSVDGVNYTEYANGSSVSTTGGVMSFLQFTFDFMATSASTTISFRNNLGETTVAALDDVALNQRAVAVPGPLAGAGLIPLIGLAGVAALRRRRQGSVG